MSYISVYCTEPIAAEGLRWLVATIDGLVLTHIYSSLRDLETDADYSTRQLVLLEVSAEVTLEVLSRIVATPWTEGVILRLDGAATEFLHQAMGMGVRGVVFKKSPLGIHAECLRAVAAGQMWVEPELSQKLLRADRITLTSRERQLMGLIAQGLTNKEIGWSMDVTEGTVKVYLSRLFAKVGASDRFGLALIALRNVFATQPGVLGRIPQGTGERAAPLPMPKFLTRERRKEAADSTAGGHNLSRGA